MKYQIKLRQKTYLDLIFQAERLGIDPDELVNNSIEQMVAFLETKTIRDLAPKTVDKNFSLQ